MFGPERLDSNGGDSWISITSSGVRVTVSPPASNSSSVTQWTARIDETLQRLDADGCAVA